MHGSKLTFFVHQQHYKSSKSPYTRSSACTHLYFHSSLWDGPQAVFKDNPELKCATVIAAQEVEDACSEAEKLTKSKSVKQVHTNHLQTSTAAEVIKTFQEWEEQRPKNALFKSMMNYLHRVETILLFITASQNADLELHLQAGETLSIFFLNQPHQV